jgi:hypothetical protein
MELSSHKALEVELWAVAGLEKSEPWDVAGLEKAELWALAGLEKIRYFPGILESGKGN